MTEAIITHYAVGERKIVTYVMNVLHQGQQWTTQRRYSEFVRFDKKLIQEGYVVGFSLPSKVVFGNFYPSVLEHRRKELNKYLRMLCSCLSSDNTYLREFFEVDENMLKHALKMNRRQSDIHRSDFIRLIYKRASQLMISGDTMQRCVRLQRRLTRRKEANASAAPSYSSGRSRSISSIGTLFSSGRSTSSAVSRTPPRLAATTKFKHKYDQIPPRSQKQQGSFSSNNDTIVDSLQETAIMEALKDDFLALSCHISSEYSKNDGAIPDKDFKDAFDDNNSTLPKAYLSNVNSCFRQKSEGNSDAHCQILSLLSTPPPPI